MPTSVMKPLRQGKEQVGKGIKEKDSGGSSFFRTFGGGARGKEREAKEEEQKQAALSVGNNNTLQWQMNVFSLVKRFTFKPLATETDLPNPPPRLTLEIQY